MADSVIDELCAIRDLLTQLVGMQAALLDALANQDDEGREPGERDPCEEL